MSAADQRRRIEEHVAASGWDLTAVIDDTGADVERGEYPGLDQLIRDSAQFDKLVIASLDRIGRRPARIRSVVLRLRDRGIDLVSVGEGFDTGVAGGPSLERTLDVFARWQPRRPSDRPRTWDPAALRAHGFTPSTLLDVGAASGTHSLYEAFGQAYLVLIEPLREYDDDLQKVLARRPGERVAAAAGAADGEATIGIDRYLVASSLLGQVGAPAPVETRQVPVRTIDGLAAERSWRGTIGMKLDVEGFEGEVIRGATETLKRCEFVIAELSVTPRFDGGPRARDLIAQLRSHGFETCDVVDGYRSREHAIADLMFKRVTRGAE